MNVKRSLACVMSVIIMLTFSTTAMAAESTPDWSALSTRSGIGIDELQEAYTTMTRSEFNAVVERCIQEYAQYPKNKTRASQIIPDTVWKNFRNSLRDGSILITSDSMTVGFMHGHAAIVSGAYNTGDSNPLNRQFYLTEHPGKDLLSKRYVLTNSTTTWWRKRNDLRVFSANSTAMTRASSTANTSVVLNKPYSAFADKNTTREYNCSSLVYRCYINAGVDISNQSSNLILPIDITRSRYVSQAFQF